MAPASPWRVPREVKEFMAAPAVELAVDAATERKKSKTKLRQLSLFILFDHRTAYSHTQEHDRAICNKEKSK